MIEYIHRHHQGYKRKDFMLNGRLAIIVEPDQPREGKKWLWRAEFLGNHDAVDNECLKRGYYLMYYSLPDMYGCPQAVEMMRNFYNCITEELGFNKKTVLIGVSRGGLYSVNFAAKYPEAMAGLYLDAPVLSIANWPAGLGKGMRYEKGVQECMELYNLTEEEIPLFKGNPIDKLDVLTTSKIPVLLFAGQIDSAVIYTENAEVLVAAYRKAELDDILLYILKPDCDHHPHGPVNDEQLTKAADFICKYY